MTDPSPQRLTRKVLLIGWDAADWNFIRPLLADGQLPTLQRLIETGTAGNIATLDPPFSPMLWTSIATGMTADKHGILGFTQPKDDGTGIRPVLGSSRKVKALWNILSQEGLRSNVVSWWPSHPAEPINGAMVSNFYHRAKRGVDEPWEVPPGTIHPAELADTLAELRVHPAEMTGAHVLPFAPSYTGKTHADLSKKENTRLNNIARMLAECASTHAAVTWLMEHTEWDFTAVYYDAIDHFSHGFMKYHPPRMASVDEHMYERFKHVMTGIYRFHDMMLERLLALAGPETTVILLSDHGFYSDHRRLDIIPNEPSAPALEHRDFGVLCMSGPGIREGEQLYGASLLDVAPTVLTLLGLPVGRDMTGRVLTQAFDTPLSPTYIDSWEDVEGESGMHTASTRLDPWAEQEALQQLIELGYVDPPGEDQQRAAEVSVNESQFYLARSFMHQNRFDEAREVLEPLYERSPLQRYGVRLVKCYQRLDRLDDARRTLDRVLAERDKKVDEAQRLAEADLADPDKDTEGFRLERRIAPGVELLQASLLQDEGRHEEALAHLQRAAHAAPDSPSTHREIGEALVRVGRWEEAALAFQHALALNAEDPRACRGLALVYLRLERNEDAAAAALRAIEIRYFYPVAHYHLGVALMRLGHYEQAADALEVCLAQRPAISKARFLLAELYRDHLDQPDRAMRHMVFDDDALHTAAPNAVPQRPASSDSDV